MDAFVKYFVFGITLAVSIGPVNIELIKRGVTKGFLASWLVGIGGMTADLVILGIIGLGAGSYLTSDFVQLLFGCIGAVMLLQIGYSNTRKGVVDRGIAVSNLLFALMASFGKTYAKPHVLRLISLASGVSLIGYGLWIGYSTVSAKWMLVVHMTAK